MGITAMETKVFGDECNRHQAETQAKMAEEMGKIMEVFRRVSSGAKVPAKDLQKLMSRIFMGRHLLNGIGRLYFFTMPAVSMAIISSSLVGISRDEMLNALNKKSGVEGLSCVSSDFRDLESAAGKGDAKAAL